MYSISSGYCRPSDRRTGASRYRATGAGIERGGHGDDRKIGPPGALQAAQQGERHVALEMALVEFVEDHGAGAFEQWGRKAAAG